MTTVPDDALDVEVGGHTVRITKPRRVLWPRAGLTKAWMIEYYVSIADVLLPHIRGHPVTLHRFPEGVYGPHWYQTRAPARPEWVRTTTFRPERTGKVFDVVVIDDVAALVWAAQIGSVELHPYLGTVDDLDHPTTMVFDLDPGAPAGPVDAAGVALRLRDVLDAAGLRAFPKTSGQKGVHVVVPLDQSQSYTITKQFARAVAGVLANEHPEAVTDVMRRDARPGKVFVDWSQNDAGKSTVAPYSLRGLELPTVSMPMEWSELADAAAANDARQLLFMADDVADRIARHGDLHAPVLSLRQRVPET